MKIGLHLPKLSQKLGRMPVFWPTLVWSPHLKHDYRECTETVYKASSWFWEIHVQYKRLELLKLNSLDLRRLYFDLTWAYNIIFGYVDMCSDDFFFFCAEDHNN